MKIAIDFDGVLHSDLQHKGSGNIILDPPVPGAIEKLYELLHCPEVEEIVIFSLRCGGQHGILAMMEWLHRHLPANSDYYKLKFSYTKPQVDVFIDDRALAFNGNWSDPQFNLDNLLKFKPWTYK